MRGEEREGREGGRGKRDEGRERERGEEVSYTTCALLITLSHLHVSLRLHEAPHDAKTGHQFPTLPACGHPGDDGVIGPLAGGQDIRMIGVQGEIRPPVLQREATPSRDEPSAESHVVAVDEGASVALGVHHREIDSLA